MKVPYRTIRTIPRQRRYRAVPYGTGMVRMNARRNRRVTVHDSVVLYRYLVVHGYRTEAKSYYVLCEIGIRIYIIPRIPLSVSCMRNGYDVISRSCL